MARYTALRYTTIIQSLPQPPLDFVFTQPLLLVFAYISLELWSPCLPQCTQFYAEVDSHSLSPGYPPPWAVRQAEAISQIPASVPRPLARAVPLLRHLRRCLDRWRSSPASGVGNETEQSIGVVSFCRCYPGTSAIPNTSPSFSHCRAQGKSKGCFHGLDTFILMLSVWSPLPVPLRPMATVQLDRFVAVDRDIPSAPLWAARVQGTKTSPLKLFRTPHWVREQLKIMLSSPVAKLDATTSRDCSFLLKEISALIVSLSAILISRALITSTQGDLGAVSALKGAIQDSPPQSASSPSSDSPSNTTIRLGVSFRGLG